MLSEVLIEYIDYNNTLDASSFTSGDYANRHSVVDFSPYLTKKPPTYSLQVPRLLEFFQSAQFNTMATYLHEQNRFAVTQETTALKQYVCKPNYRHMTGVHGVLQ